jgi:hypothetical protein
MTLVTGGGLAFADAIGMKRPGQIQAEKAGRTYYVPHSSYDFVRTLVQAI